MSDLSDWSKMNEKAAERLAMPPNSVPPDSGEARQDAGRQAVVPTNAGLDAQIVKACVLQDDPQEDTDFAEITVDAIDWLDDYAEPIRIRDGEHKAQIARALIEFAAHVCKGRDKEIKRLTKAVVGARDDFRCILRKCEMREFSNDYSHQDVEGIARQSVSAADAVLEQAPDV
jgi:hypothetical protein